MTIEKVSTRKEFTLTMTEYEIAAYVGFQRQVGIIREDKKDQTGHEEIGYDKHVLGAIGEYIVAKHLGVFWTGLTKFGATDVGPYQVRTASTTSTYAPSLIIRPGDPDNQISILVTGKELTYTIVGWLWGRDAKRPEFRRQPQNRPWAFFVPQHCLYPIDDLDIGR